MVGTLTTNYFELYQEMVIDYLVRLTSSVSVNKVRVNVNAVKRGDDITATEQFDYSLNYAPNQYQTMPIFLQHCVRRLLVDNKLLLVKYNDNYLIADDYEVGGNIIDGITFTKVIVKNPHNHEEYMLGGRSNPYIFKNTEAQFIEYNAKSMQRNLSKIKKTLEEALKAVFTDLNASKIHSIILALESDRNDNEAMLTLRQLASTTIKQVLRGESNVGLAPAGTKLVYSNKDMQASSSRVVDDLQKMLDTLLSQLCWLYGVPKELLKGDDPKVAELFDGMMTATLKPIFQTLEVSLNILAIPRDQLEHGGELNINLSTIEYVSIFRHARQIDKLVSSGVMKINEIRTYLNLLESPDLIANTRFITKNFTGNQEFETTLSTTGNTVENQKNPTFKDGGGD